MKLTNHNFPRRAQSIVGAIRAELQQAANPRPPRGPHEPLPFVTISRQAGAGGRTLAKRLAERLGALGGGGTGDGGEWHAWDHELIEKVSREHDLEQALVEALEDSRHAWVQEFLAGFPSGGGGKERPDEFKVYRRVAHTIRGLANAGGAIIVGRGGVFVTRDLPGGVHVRLVAPLADRIENMARRLDCSTAEATRWVTEVDRNREAFYRRYWPGKSVTPETFTVTLNTAGLTEEQMVAAVLPLIPGVWERQAGAAAAAVQTAGAIRGGEEACCGCREKAGENVEARTTTETHPIGDAPREARHGTWHAGATR